MVVLLKLILALRKALEAKLFKLFADFLYGGQKVILISICHLRGRPPD